jgi:hypothetical protein
MSVKVPNLLDNRVLKVKKRPIVVDIKEYNRHNSC